MKYWPFMFLIAFSAYAQYEGDYTLVAEKDGCPEGTLIVNKERVIFGGRLSFELSPLESKSQEEECFYHTKVTHETNADHFKVTRWTERSKCKDAKFNGTSEEELYFDKNGGRYSIASADPTGKKQEDIKCQFKKD